MKRREIALFGGVFIAFLGGHWGVHSMPAQKKLRYR